MSGKKSGIKSNLSLAFLFGLSDKQLIDLQSALF